MQASGISGSKCNRGIELVRELEQKIWGPTLKIWFFREPIVQVGPTSIGRLDICDSVSERGKNCKDDGANQKS